MTNNREWAAVRLNNSARLRDLGLPPDSVFDADTADSPTEKPFIVLRWGEEQPGMGNARVFPLDLWVYDGFGDHSRCARIADAAADELAADLPSAVGEEGWVYGLDTKGSGLGRGGDLKDDGYDALVVPYHVRVVSTAG